MSSPACNTPHHLQHFHQTGHRSSAFWMEEGRDLTQWPGLKHHNPTAGIAGRKRPLSAKVVQSSRTQTSSEARIPLVDYSCQFRGKFSNAAPFCWSTHLPGNSIPNQTWLSQAWPEKGNITKKMIVNTQPNSQIFGRILLEKHYSKKWKNLPRKT